MILTKKRPIDESNEKIKVFSSILRYLSILNISLETNFGDLNESSYKDIFFVLSIIILSSDKTNIQIKQIN